MTRAKHRIIIEGLDGSGKSTLVEHLLIHVPNLELIRNDREANQNFDVWWPQILDRPDIKGITPIHDRFFYSELVYGPIIRGRINADPNVVQNALWFLRSTALLIYARPHSDRLRAGVGTKQQMKGVVEKFDELLELYDQLMAAEKTWYSKRFVHYVWHQENELERVEKLVRGYLRDEFPA